jgi:folate-binding protein YgfZ
MSELSFAPLDHRALIAVSGEDRHTFLQGLVSNDVAHAAPGHAAWSAFLTPQGRFLHEFFMSETALADGSEAIILEAEADRRADLVRRLSMYRLRSKVAVAPMAGRKVYALWGAGAAEAIGLADRAGAAKAFAGGLVFVDPRLKEAGLRAWLPLEAEAELQRAGFAPAPPDGWDAHRIALGLPDGSRDLVPDKSFLLENGFDELSGVDWHKGCYMGQELTARTKYRGLVRKRLMPVVIDGPAPAPGTIILLGADEAGEMRSSAGRVGLAMIRLEQFAAAQATGAAMVAGSAKLHPMRPTWAAWDEQAAATQ